MFDKARQVSGRLLIALCAALGLPASLANAQAWPAAVIANGGTGAEEGQTQADLAQAGFERSDLQIIRNVVDGDPPGMAQAIASLSGAERAVLFFEGPTSLSQTGEIQLGSAAIPPVFARQLSLDSVAARLAEGGTRELAVILDDCHGRAPGSAGQLSELSVLPSPPLELLIAFSAGPGGRCGPPAERVGALLAAADRPFRQIEDLDAALASATVLRIPATLLPEEGRERSAGAVDFGPMTLSLGDADATEMAREDTASGLRIGRRGVAGPDAETKILRVGIRPDDPIIRERPGGLRPSILIGVLPSEMETLLAPEDPPEPETPGSTEEPTASAEQDLPPAPPFDDRTARDALRLGDPETFALLLNTGAMDPPDPNRLPLALQTEMKSMGCYTSSLDNQWGPGSERALVAYANERGVDAAALSPGLQPTRTLWREIISAAPVVCPQRTVTAKPKTTAPAPARNTTPSRPASTTQAKPAPAPAPARKSSSGNNLKDALRTLR